MNLKRNLIRNSELSKRCLLNGYAARAQDIGLVIYRHKILDKYWIAIKTGYWIEGE